MRPAVALDPAALAVMDTERLSETRRVISENVSVRWPAGTVRVAGKLVKRLAFEVLRLIT